MPDLTYSSRSNYDSAVCGHAVSQQAVCPAKPDITHARSDGGHSVRRAKRARSPQGRGTASNDEGQHLHKVQKTEPTFEQRLSQATLQRMKAPAQVLTATQHRIAERSRHQAKTGKLINFWDEGAAHQMLEALRDDGRQRALTHVGITSTATARDGKLWGERIARLAYDWMYTYNSVLTGEHEKEIAARFGRHFISFLNGTHQSTLMKRYMGVPEADSLAYALSRDMPWKERDFIMQTIDEIDDKRERRGARTAYLAFLGRTSRGKASWKDEKKLARAKVHAEWLRDRHVHV